MIRFSRNDDQLLLSRVQMLEGKRNSPEKVAHIDQLVAICDREILRRALSRMSRSEAEGRLRSAQSISEYLLRDDPLADAAGDAFFGPNWRQRYLPREGVQGLNPGQQLDGLGRRTTNAPHPNRPTKLTDTQAQQLIQLMDERVLKLCDGTLYAIDGMRPDTEAAIHLESGLLLNLLYRFLSDGADCEAYWRRILFAVCKKYSPDKTPDGLDKALEMARVYREAWQEEEGHGHGPLLRVLAMGACMAFGVGMDNPKLVARLSMQMAQEADPLITAVSRVIGGD